MRHGFNERKKDIKKVSQEAVELLLDQAGENAGKQPGRSRRYVQMAFGLIKKHRIRLSRGQRLRFCKKCLRYWIPGETLAVTFEPARHALLFTCLCGAKRRVVMGTKKAGRGK